MALTEMNELDTAEVRRLLNQWVSELYPIVVLDHNHMVIGLTAFGMEGLDFVPIPIASSAAYALERGVMIAKLHSIWTKGESW